jgi:hypothetical protein
MTERQPWTYKGIGIWPADRNSSGIRWYARTADDLDAFQPGTPAMLRADTKDGIRELITHYKKASK